MVIEDDGVGFDMSDRNTSTKGIGLAGMQERAGLINASLQVESTPGDGTSIFLRSSITRAAAPRSS
jgi:signal transduction histidine kinase